MAPARSPKLFGRHPRGVRRLFEHFLVVPDVFGDALYAYNMGSTVVKKVLYCFKMLEPLQQSAKIKL